MFSLKKILPEKIEQKHFIIFGILVVAAFLRLYNIPNTVQFLGDQGRDALIVAKIFKELNPVFIGPVTSIGNMYLGPLYYYFMLPFLMFTYPSPMGPVYAVALLGVLTVFLMYYLGKKIVNEKAALWGSALFGLSAVAAHNTRFSWNPNPAPIVSLFMMYFTYKAFKKDTRYWIGVTICFAILIQLHYLTLLSGAGFGAIWIYQIIKKYNNKKPIKKMLVSTLIGVLVFFASLTPLMLFDLKHDGVNRKAFASILTEKNAFNKEKVQDDTSPIVLAIKDLKNRGEFIISDITIGEHSNNLNFYVSILVIFVFLKQLNDKYKSKKDITGDIVLASFLFTGIIGTSLYKQNLYEHYIAYLFPIVFLTLGVVMNNLVSKKKYIAYLVVAFYLSLFIKFNYNHAKVILNSLGWTIAHTQGVAKTIEDRVEEGEKYNIVLLNATGDIYGQNYRYFLSTSHTPPVDQEQFGEVDTLFIIDEERKIKNETDSPIYEIVTFPNKKPAETYFVPGGPEIIVLRKNTN
jgi:4-amino-4-deoxy-L-arabinose transferase-like glycosyltransferase